MSTEVAPADVIDVYADTVPGPRQRLRGQRPTSHPTPASSSHDFREITQLSPLTVVGLCRRLRIMPEDIWDPAVVARVFQGFPPNTFDDEES